MADTTGPQKPLDDVRVLELTQMVAGPVAGMTLADLGADVIKIERPEHGEIARNIEPEVGSESFYYLSVNRGKRSVAIDLKSEAGRSLFLEMVEDADVVLENFTPGTTERLGIHYEAVRERNPEIIYCSISGFGQFGPKSDRSGVDGVIQSFSGVASLTRDSEGIPQVTGLPISDISGSMYAAIGILESIRMRDKTGEGDYLDVALTDASMSFLSARAGYSFATGETFPSMKEHPYFAPVSFYRTTTGFIRIAIVTERQWSQLCEAIERPDLVNNPKYETMNDRLENRNEVNAEISKVIADRSTEDWVTVFEKYDFPFSEVHDTVSIWEDDHTIARKMKQTIDVPGDETFDTVAYPVKHNTDTWTPGNDWAAELGEHTVEVLREVGYDQEEIERLRDEEAIE